MILPVADITPPVEKLPAMMLPEPEIDPAEPVVVIPAPVRLPTALTPDPVLTLPLDDINPVTYTPVLAITAILLIPATVITILALATGMLIALVPLAIALDVPPAAFIPVSADPLPKKYEPVTLPVTDTNPPV